MPWMVYSEECVIDLLSLSMILFLLLNVQRNDPRQYIPHKRFIEVTFIWVIRYQGVGFPTFDKSNATSNSKRPSPE
jgi:hypothetical protein